MFASQPATNWDGFAPARAFSRDQITAHLAYVAAELQDVAVFIEDDVVLGDLDFPDPETGLVPLLAYGAPVGPIALDTEVRLVYTGGEDRFCFVSPFRGFREDGAWLLGFPTALQTTQKRLTRRHALPMGWTFLVTGTPKRVEVLDLSAAGCAVSVGLSERVFASGRTVRGVLEGPGGWSLCVRLGVRHLRDVDGVTVAGCLFEGMDALDYIRIATAVAELGVR